VVLVAPEANLIVSRCFIQSNEFVISTARSMKSIEWILLLVTAGPSSAFTGTLLHSSSPARRHQTKTTFLQPPKVGSRVKHGSKNLCSICAICALKSQNLCFSTLFAITLSVFFWGGAEEILAPAPQIEVRGWA